ncbi:MAG: hypothetical protein BJ554DRAFT_4673 [Olpidium bornovanus]|uniref:Uncharacterized protein n=1 Tax=Olpidium bornovanus TaxID=278681 RepID=A0A8H7ZMN8_9FUNG|nr:MAG: hypothetical protein BJ554DRAFT_4673 [Olpidium bornovanus]
MRHPVEKSTLPAFRKRTFCTLAKAYRCLPGAFLADLLLLDLDTDSAFQDEKLRAQTSTGRLPSPHCARRLLMEYLAANHLDPDRVVVGDTVWLRGPPPAAK